MGTVALRKDYEKLLIKLLSIPSVADKPEKLVEALEFLLELLPPEFTVEKFSSNTKPSALIYHGKTRPQKFEVLLNAHLDVVPAKPEQFTPVRIGGKLYARGACDMKSAALIMVLAFIELAGSTSKPIGLQLVCDEELGGIDGTGYQMSQGIKANFAVIGEHTDLDINIESKGVCMVKLTAYGQTAHSAYQWQGTSAVDTLLRALMNLREAYPLFDKETWATSLNIAIIGTPNTATNAVADSGSAHLDFRFVNQDPVFTQDKEKVVAALQRIAGEEAAVDILFFETRHFVPKDNRHVQLLADVISKHTKRPARFVKKHGSSDVRYYTQKGIEGITFGPLCEGPHCDDECVDLAGLQMYYAIVCGFLERL